MLCGKPVEVSAACAHFIPRSHGGLGVEQNILTLCLTCHTAFDNSAERKQLKVELKEYLKNQYPNWEKERLAYRKWSY